ncbi:hypothetical protein KP509_23G080800 [Ceratopteris richardii]|uniref:Uncharacterized protein n=1 Tax=Ceratopteris richardii TaxID=49495 RepID=A0A8T2S4P8_CERRI|nr:hypothetical protein KP509_23G080800 [Ceratopteris richardii]
MVELDLRGLPLVAEAFLAGGPDLSLNISLPHGVRCQSSSSTEESKSSIEHRDLGLELWKWGHRRSTETTRCESESSSSNLSEGTAGMVKRINVLSTTDLNNEEENCCTTVLSMANAAFEREKSGIQTQTIKRLSNENSKNLLTVDGMGVRNNSMLNFSEKSERGMAESSPLIHTNVFSSALTDPSPITRVHHFPINDATLHLYSASYGPPLSDDRKWEVSRSAASEVPGLSIKQQLDRLFGSRNASDAGSKQRDMNRREFSVEIDLSTAIRKPTEERRKTINSRMQSGATSEEHDIIASVSDGQNNQSMDTPGEISSMIRERSDTSLHRNQQQQPQTLLTECDSDKVAHSPDRRASPNSTSSMASVTASKQLRYVQGKFSTKRSMRAPRMRWTTHLHAHFVHAVEALGGHESTPL